MSTVAVSTDRVSMLLDGQLFKGWTRVEITRDLENLAGSFRLEARDDIRSLAALQFATLDDRYRLRPGPPCEILLDGEPVLKGHVETVSPSLNADHARVAIAGRDVTGDLVDSAASPHGPAEYRDIKLEDFATRICDPFSIPVVTDVDTGRPFKRASIEVAETALSALNGHARARGVLMLSDGIGNLRLTKSGNERAPVDLALPGNMTSSKSTFKTEERHSETIVKGQAESIYETRPGVHYRVTDAPTNPSAPSGSTNTERERSALSPVGVASDQEVERHRPRVIYSRKQPDERSPQEEAEWQMRTAKARCEQLSTDVVDWRAAGGGLWKPNQQVSVDDAFSGIQRDMLIAGVVYRFDENGPKTALTLKDLESYDLGR